MDATRSQLLQRENCALIVIDIQEKLVRVVKEASETIENIVRLVKFSDIIGLPLVFTEQENLGETVKEIREEVADFQAISKIAFSCFGSNEFRARIKELNKSCLIMAGIEAHICVAQTALNAMPTHTVHMVADAVASRSPHNKEISLERLRQSGVVVTSTEMLMYELLVKAGTDEFRRALKLVT
jgi:isochorismate hydrolase